MANQILNGREYKGLPDTFLYDLKTELAVVAEAPASVRMPVRGVRVVPRRPPALFRDIVGTKAEVQRRADDSGDEFVVTWAVPGPDGGANWLTGTAPYTGVETAEDAFNATLAEATALFDALWSVP